MSNESGLPKFDVGLSAKVELNAEVPAQSIGRLLDALTDILRPFSEARGLRGDQIRLQREDVAIEIAKKARQRLAIEKAAFNPVPNKILIPLIEKGSLEDIDNEYMINMWANLLASAATDKHVEPRYISLLSELSGNQVSFLRNIAASGIHLVDAPYISFSEYNNIVLNNVAIQLSNIFREMQGGKESFSEAYERIDTLFRYPGRTGYLIVSKNNEEISKVGTDIFSDCDESNSADILESLGLLRLHNMSTGPTRSLDGLGFSGYYVELTRLGRKLIEFCDVDLINEMKRLPKISE